MRVMLLVNPRAGPAGTACPPERFADPMRAWGWEVDVQPSPADDETARRLVERARAEPPCDALVVAGGDGTLHRLANALAGSELPLGILPCGTANDLARALGLPLDPDAALCALRDAESLAIDLGRLNGRYFLNVAALGLSADLSAEISEEQKRRMGHRAYAWNALRRLRAPGRPSARRLALRLSTDQGADSLEVLQLSVGNGPSFGGGWSLTREARLTDRLLDVVVLEPLGLWAVLARLLFRRGALTERVASRRYRLSACRVDLESFPDAGAAPRPALAVTLDGEALSFTPPLDFEVVPAALRVLLPKAKPASTEAGTREQGLPKRGG